jgi:hypothetical protein
MDEMSETRQMAALREVAHGMSYRRSKSELRRQRRGFRFPAVIADVQMLRGHVLVVLRDGSRWRLFLRGGKSFRRRLRA